MRLVQGDLAGEWQPLARVVRLPRVTAVTCPAATGACTLTGEQLFLIAGVATEADPARAQAVPLGFVGEKLEVPHPANGALFLKLHDAPADMVRVTVPAKRGK